MFGIVRPCRHGMCGGLYADWMGHLCGLCLALRDEHGHASRLVTNYDGLLVSVLTEAQSPASAPRRRAAPCALRGFRSADVVQAEGVRLAAAVSLILAAGKIHDHVADGDGPYARRLVASGATRLADRWAAAGAGTSAAIGFDPAPLTAAVAEQTRLETLTGLPLRDLTAPAEDAVAAAFAHTAVLTDRPHNRAPLEAAGRAFGRLAHLLDAVEDLAEDRASGAYNPLISTGTGLPAARRHCDEAHAALRAAVAELDLERPHLARALLVRETGHAITRTFTTAYPATLIPAPAALTPTQPAAAPALTALATLTPTTGRTATITAPDTHAPTSGRTATHARITDRDAVHTHATDRGVIRTHATGRAATGAAPRSGGDAPSTPPDAPFVPPNAPETPDAPEERPARPAKRDPGGLLSWACAALTCCSCGLYRPPWDEEREDSACSRFDCSGWDSCGSCSECCSGDGCCCSGCDCGCDC